MLLEDYATKETVPNSLNISIEAEFEKTFQAQVDRGAQDAASIFQKAVLASIIAVWKKELDDKNKARDDVVENLLNYLLTKLTNMRTKNIVHTPGSNLSESYYSCEQSFVEICQEVEDDARIEEYFEFQQKQESMEKAQEAREEARFNQVLNAA